MDPNATLEELRRLVDGLLNPKAKLRHGFTADARDVAELFDALDGWLSNGGFKPTAWK